MQRFCIVAATFPGSLARPLQGPCKALCRVASKKCLHCPSFFKTTLWQLILQACKAWRTSPFRGDKLSSSTPDVCFGVSTAETLMPRRPDLLNGVSCPWKWCRAEGRGNGWEDDVPVAQVLWHCGWLRGDSHKWRCPKMWVRFTTKMV